MAPRSTRLLVLGAIRRTGPAHGYDLRRELLSWGAGEWANVAPGSIYSSLKTLVREGLLEVIGHDRQGARPERTTYRLTEAGEAEFQRLLQDNLWRSRALNHPLLAGLAFLPLVPPDELVEVMRERAEAVGRQAEACRAAIAGLESSNRSGGGVPPGVIPPHVAESLRLVATLLEGEAGWARDLAERAAQAGPEGLWPNGV